MKTLEPLYIVGGNVNGAVAIKNSMIALQKLKIELICNPVIPLSGMYTKEL